MYIFFIATFLKTNEAYLLSSGIPLPSWIATYLGLIWHTSFLFWGDLPVSDNNSPSLNSTKELLNLYNISTGDSVHSIIVHDLFYRYWLVVSDFESMRKSMYSKIWHGLDGTHYLYQGLLVNFCIQLLWKLRAWFRITRSTGSLEVIINCYSSSSVVVPGDRSTIHPGNMKSLDQEWTSLENIRRR